MEAPDPAAGDTSFHDHGGEPASPTHHEFSGPRGSIDGGSRSADAAASKSSTKKGKEREKDDGAGQGTEKRHRVHFSCSECHRRKQKCDRQQPCSNCVNRRIPHLCRTFDPTTDSSDVATRLARLEKLVGDYLPAILDRLDGHRTGTMRSDLSSRQPPSSAAGTAAEEEADEDVRGSFGPTGRYNSSSTNVYAVGTVLANVPPQEIPVAAGQMSITPSGPNQDLDSLLADFGWPTLGGNVSPSAMLIAALPHPATCELLIDHFYKDLNWLRHPLPQRSLREAFARFFESGPKLALGNLNTFAILALICSIASLSIDSSVFTGKQHSRIVATRRLQWAARQALAMSFAAGNGNTDTVIAWALLARVLVLERRTEEACLASASCIKLAQAIGLHRDGSKLKFGPAETEQRRRIWAGVFTSECYLSWHLGRPSCLQKEAIDSQAPSEADDEGDIYPITIHRPPGTPFITAMTVHRYRFQLGAFFLRICELQQSVRPAPYSEILAVDRELLEWRDSLPPYFKCPLGPTGAIEMDTSYDDYYPFLPPQRYLLESDFDQSRICLHRSYLLLSRNKGGSRYLPSRRACIEAAHHDILHRSALVASMGAKFNRPFINIWNVHYHSTKHFSSVAICGIALLSDPNSAQAATLRGHLVNFLDIAKLKEQHSPDSPFLEVYKREAHIIRMFLDKADELAAAPTRPRMRSLEESAAARKRALMDDTADGMAKRQRSGSDRRDEASSHIHDGDEHATANVLLGLGQSQPVAQNTPGSYTSTSNGRSPVADDAQNILDAWFQGGYQQPANDVLDFGLTALSSAELASLPSLPNTAIPSVNPASSNGMLVYNTGATSLASGPNFGAIGTTYPSTIPPVPPSAPMPMAPASVGPATANMAGSQQAGGAFGRAAPDPAGLSNFQGYWETLIDKIVH